MHLLQRIQRMASWRTPHPARNGFTLIEVLMAMAIFAIGFLAVTSMQTTSIKGNEVAHQKSEMAAAAAARMERLLALPYDDPSLDPGERAPLPQDNDGFDNDYDGQVDEAGETGEVSVVWEVTRNDPLSNTKTITVTVSRSSQSNATRQVVVSSNKADII